MEKYVHYQINDFIQDESFINWCLTDKSDDDELWSQLKESDFLSDKINQAEQIVLAIHKSESTSSLITVDDKLWNEIDSQLDPPKNNSFKDKRRWFVGIAASLLVAAALSFQFFDPLISSVVSESPTTQEWKNIQNTDGIALEIRLPDSSLIVLEPFSTLKYPNFFSQEQRTVFLKGEAFFKIERDTLRPFLVYANETITKVLGTSFTIKAFEGQETVEVDVKSGKVAVYAKVASEKEDKKKRIILQTDEEIIVPLPNKKLEVTPNHRVVFDRKIELLTRKITKSPQILHDIKMLPQFSFKDESVNKVFNAISQIYGVQMDYNDDELADCLITTKLEDEPLYQVLEILCTALDLEFEEVNARIIISGQGCQS